MSRSARWSFLCVALFLVTFPLVLAKPGMPMTLKSDEPAYYLMALSLVHDHDLVCDLGDIQRLATEFPYQTTKNLILATNDGWRTVVYGKPYLVSLLVAPFVALAGANGFIAANMAMLLLSVWLGARYLRQFNSEFVSLLFAAGFFLLSNAFAYVFWLHTEVLCLASVTACLYLAFTPAEEAPPVGRWARFARRFWNGSTRPFFSGAVLVAAAYNKPYLAALGLPALWLAWRQQGGRGALRWLAGAVAASVVVCAISIALIGKPSAYLGLERQGVSVTSFDRMPDLPKPRPVSAKIGPAASFGWIFQSFRMGPEFLPNLGYFFVGRHTGLFVYAPFALLATILFLLFSRRSAERWLLAACLAGIALYTLTFIWFNWHGGGGFIGNRYYVHALPGFLFLVTRIAPDWLPAIGYLLGGLFVGGFAITPYGASVPSPTLQAHTRNAPFRFLPFERTLAALIPGYRDTVGNAGSYLFGRSDQFRPVGNSLWVVGGQRVEFEMRTVAPLTRSVWEVATFVAPNRVRLELGEASTVVELDSTTRPGNSKRIVLSPGEGTLDHYPNGRPYRYYRLVVEAERQTWHSETVQFRESKKGRGAAQREVEAGVVEPDWTENDLTALVGAVVTFLGEESELEADVYSIDWRRIDVASRLPAGRIVAFPGRVRNTSSAIWRAHGASSIALAYHWRLEDGTEVVRDGLRTTLPRDVAPGKTADVMFEIETPREPGRYELVFDAVHERVAWFSDRRPESTLVRSIEIVPADAAPPGGASAR